MNEQINRWRGKKKLGDVWQSRRSWRYRYENLSRSLFMLLVTHLSELIWNKIGFFFPSYVLWNCSSIMDCRKRKFHMGKHYWKFINEVINTYKMFFLLQVLGLYALVFMVALPVAVGIWWHQSIKFGGDQVLLDTTKLYYYFISKSPQMNLKRKYPFYNSMIIIWLP